MGGFGSFAKSTMRSSSSRSSDKYWVPKKEYIRRLKEREAHSKSSIEVVGIKGYEY